MAEANYKKPLLGSKWGEAIWVGGIFSVSLGVALCSAADLGVSMIAAPAFIIYEAAAPAAPWLTVGTAEYMYQGLILIATCLLIRRFDWRFLLTFAVAVIYGYLLDMWLTVVCLVVVVLSLFLQFSNFMGKRAREFMGIYYDAQEKMSASAVQYVRGMPVVKIFGQSVRSFRQFNAEIQAYKTFALKCCDTYQNGMIAFTVLLNSTVTFILPMGILLMQASPQSLSLAVVWLFFIIMGPGMASPVYKLTFLGGNTRDIDEGVNRIDRILEKKPVPEPGHPQVPATYDVEFRHVSFSYENTEQGTRTEALRDISFIAPHCPCRSVRKRQINDCQPDTSVLGCGARENMYRWCGYSPNSYRKTDGYGIVCLSRHVPVLRHAVREHRRRLSNCYERKGDSRSQSCPMSRFHRASSTRLRDTDRRQRCVPLRRRSATDMCGSCHIEECSDTGVGRSDCFR